MRLLGAAGAKPDYATLLATLRSNVGLEATNRILARGSRDCVELGIAVTSDTLKRGAAFILDGVVENDWLSLRLDGLQRVAGRSKLGAFHYVPVLFHESRGLTVAQKRLVARFSVVLADLQGKTPEMGFVWHGRECRVSSVVVKAHLRHTVNLYESLRQMQADGSAMLSALKQRAHRSICHPAWS